MRMEHFPIMNRGEFGIERYDPDTNKVLIGGRGNVPRDAGTERADRSCGRRASGLAYRLTEKTVIRAGFGITNDPYPLSRPIRSPYPGRDRRRVHPVERVCPGGRPAHRHSGSRQFPDLSTGVVDIPNTVSTNSLQAGEFRRGYIESFNFTDPA